MSEILTKAAEAMSPKVAASGFDRSLKIAVEGEGALMITPSGVSLNDEDADCTLSMNADTFQGLITGSVNPTTAFMTGKIKASGDMTVAMKLSGIFG